MELSKVNLCVICGRGLIAVGAEENEGTTGEEEEAPVLIKKEGRASCDGFENQAKASLFVGRVWTEEERSIYQWFLKCFRLRFTKKEKNRKSKSNGWDEDSGEDPFPFCGTCKSQLLEVLELQRKIVELEERVKSKVNSLKEKATECEDTFEGSGVYEKDMRYWRVRKQIVTDLNLRHAGANLIRHDGIRKSSRSTAPAANILLQDLSGNSDILSTVQPSESDQFTAEQPFPYTPIKSETSCDNDGADEYEPLLHAETVGESTSIRILRKRIHRPKNPKHLVTELTSKPAENYDEPLDFTISEDMDDRFEDEAEESRDDQVIQPTPPPSSSKNCKKRKHTEISVRNRKSSRKLKKKELSASKIPDSPPHSRKRTSTRKELQDEDWVPGEEAGMKAQIEDSADEEDDSDNVIDLETGKRKHTRLKIDPKTNTFTYKHLVFYPLDSPTSKMLQCSECRSEVKRHCVAYHFRSQHSNRFACNQCDYRGGCKSNLQSHIARVHEGAPSHQRQIVNCRICEKPLPISRRKHHEWTHKNQHEKQEAIACKSDEVPITQLRKDHQCDQCGSSFPNRSTLKHHKEKKHASKEEKESRMELCPHCGGTYADIRFHLRMQHETDKLKIYTCLESNCGKLFKKLALLTKHKNAVHRKIRPFKCTMCPREFSNQGSFTNHMNLHNGVRPWQCEHCSITFSDKSLLRRHIGKYHTPGVTPPKRKPYVRGPTMLGTDVRKRDLLSEGKYLPPSALASWAAGREPTSHFPVEQIDPSKKL